MSHAAYVAQLDEDQLSNLIEQASARREAIGQTGWVKLWTLNIGWANVAWFAEDDHATAVEFAIAEIKRSAAKRPGVEFQMELSLERYRPEEALRLLARRNAAG